MAMARNHIIDAQHIVPDRMIQIEMSRTASSNGVRVRVLVADTKNPYEFDFASMAAAIEFYESLWSLRTTNGDKDRTPHC